MAPNYPDGPRPSDPHPNTTQASTTVTRDVEAIFGPRWILAAQRAGRGMDMGGFPSGDFNDAATVSSPLTTTGNHWIPPRYRGASSTTAPLPSGDINDMASLRPSDTRDTDIRVANYADNRTTADNLNISGIGPGMSNRNVTFSSPLTTTGNNWIPPRYRGASSTTAPLPLPQESQARSETTLTTTGNNWIPPRYRGAGSTTAPLHAQQLQAQARPGTTPTTTGNNWIATRYGGASSTTAPLHAQQSQAQARPGTTPTTTGNNWIATRYGGSSSTTAPPPLPQQSQARSGTAYGAPPLPNEARDVTSTDSGAARSTSTESLAGTDGSVSGVSPNYQGDTSLPENISAAIPVEQSTSLYIRGMGPSVTFRDILGAIRNTGRVYSLHLNPPNETHFGSAAKICFFTRAAAETFYNNTRNGFLINGSRSAVVLWNRVLVPEHNRDHWRKKDWCNACRVVLVRGPKAIVNRANILAIINAGIRMYDLERMTEDDYIPTKGFSQIEMHFGSFRAQAHSAFIVLSRELAGKGCKVFYGVDPCE